MKAFIDSPLFIYLNTITDPMYRVLYENYYIDLLSKHKLYTDPLVLDELLYISKKKYNIPYDVTIDFIQSIILPYISIACISINEIEKAMDMLLKYRTKPSDALHMAVALSENISTIVTEDTEYDKISGIKREWITLS